MRYSSTQPLPYSTPTQIYPTNRTIPCPTLPYPSLPCPTLPYPALPYHVNFDTLFQYFVFSLPLSVFISLQVIYILEIRIVKQI